MKRIWILGAEGHIGSALVKLLDRLEYEIFPTDKTDVDVTDEAEVVDYARMNRPDVIINCAGYTDVEQCEQNVEMAFKINAIGARNVAVAAQKVGAKMVLMSTDDVFDGMNHMSYTEFDTARPRSVYGKSKLAGEKFVKTMVNRYLIIRSSWIYGVGRDMVNYAIEKVGKQRVLRVPNNQFASPTSARALAETIANLVEHDEYGIYHVTNQGVCSRYDLAREVLRLLGKDKEIELVPEIDPDSATPVYSVLDNLMLRITDMKLPKPWQEELADYIKETGGLE